MKTLQYFKVIKDKVKKNTSRHFKETKIVSNHWDRKAQQEDLRQRKFVDWMNHPFVEKYYINRQISNNPDENWLIYVKNKYVLNHLDLGLTLGCGDGGLERHALKIGICNRFEAYDIAEGAIAIAKKNALQHGIGSQVKYKVADINHIQLTENKYDIAFASMSAHHFRELEHILDQVRKALKPNGIFALCEYIGPTKFQWTGQQIELINGLLKILPVRYRKFISFLGEVKTFIKKPTIEEMNNIDPSEAIRSGEIMTLLVKYFNILEVNEFGGTILHMLLQDIAGNFDPEREEDMTILNLICYFEEILIKKKVITSDFALIIAQNI